MPRKTAKRAKPRKTAKRAKPRKTAKRGKHSVKIETRNGRGFGDGLHTMTLDPKRITGFFAPRDSKFIAKHGSGPVTFVAQDWHRLGLWNASEDQTPTFDLEQLLVRMQHADIQVRRDAQNLWMMKILEGMRPVFSERQFHDGRVYGGPKIHARTYKRGIPLIELTQILIEHRALAHQWYITKDAKAAEKVAKDAEEETARKTAKTEAKARAAAEAAEAAEERQSTPDNWDDE